ncbi:MAG TPA: patatin-like phospholipase family protein [Burkholderiales bacterium]|nr:patatin-like phospholipase family protein [Burkholderiales bacterium]
MPGLRIIVAGACLAASGIALAQGAPAPARPKIGLALSGGGARGAAHIGVLKVLEELRVPVDCVTGTSMGSVVGGSFAAGTTPADMERIVTQTDWSGVFTDRPPRAEISPRLKQDDYKGLFAPEFGVRGGSLVVQKGIVSGVNIESFLRYLTQQSGSVADFRKLPVPFRAVATDIETGEAVVLDHGSLYRAMRASMAIPGAVAPVEIDGRLLVDGGIANNLPIDVARKMCGEVIIAVNISTPPLEREEITSALSIVGQLINFLGKERVDKQLAGLTKRDVLIQPELGNISSGSFDHMAEAIRIGEAAARSQADELRRYSLPKAEYEALRKRQIVPRSDSLGHVDEIRFEGIERTNSAVLLQLMDTKPGDEVTEASLTRDLRRIYGRGDFESVDYRIDEGSAARALVIRVKEKETGPNYIRFGLTLATEGKGDSYFNVLASYRSTWVNRFGAEWKLETQVGQDSYAFTEFYQPLTRYGAFFVAPYAKAGQSYRGVYSGNDRVAEYTIRENRAGLDAGMNFGQWGELRLGPVWRTVRTNVQTGLPILPDVETNASGGRIRLFGDRLDQVWFPRDGHRFVVTGYRSTTAMGADADYSRGELSYVRAISWGEHTFQAGAYGGTNFGSNLPAYDSFVLGGPFRLSAYAINQFSGQQAAFGTLRYLNQVKRLPSPLGSGVYAGASLELGRVNKLDDARNTSGNLESASIFFGADTFLGPAWIGAGFAPGGTKSLFLLVGVPGV